MGFLPAGPPHFIMSDTDIERLGKTEADRAEARRRFWFPTDDTRGPQGMPMGSNLSP